ncbi:MAG: hypothetical protein LBG30_03585 [Odoribacteraceae bacterium]|jgi:hypothetical protein|nr:hypothetical protein [Odoribacteraceae bacterium]
MIKKSSIYLLLATALLACKRDADCPPTGDADVEIALSATDTRSPLPAPGSAAEDAIDELDVLLFDKDHKFLARRRAYKLPAHHGHTSLYRATVPAGEGYELHVFSNCRALLDSRDPAEGAGELLVAGAAWPSIREGLVDYPARLLPSPAGRAPLPAWSMVERVDIRKDVVTRVDVAMLRAVASVDIDASPVRDSFKLEGARLYFAPDRGRVAYTSVPAPPAYNTAPYVPPDMQTTFDAPLVAADADNALLSKLYLYENPYNTRDESARQRTRVVIAGRFKGKRDADWRPLSYYPVDFIKHEKQDVYRQINRNWKYLFNIVEVSGPGYDTPDVASENYPVNLRVTAINWNQVHEEILVDGPYRVSIARREALLCREAGARDDVAANSNIPLDQLKMNFLSTVNGAQVSVANGIRNDCFQVEKVADSDGRLAAIGVIALQAYDPARALDAVEITFGGRVSFRVSIEQTNRSHNGWVDGGEEEIEDL